MSRTGNRAQAARLRAREVRLALLLREQIQGSERLYAAVAAAAPQGQHRTVADASHVTLPMSRPDAVTDAVSDLLDRARARQA